jgi:hypothetical protein
VWDRPHFVLAHREYYQHSAISRAKKQIQQRDSKPFFYFLEFVKTEQLAHPEIPVADAGPLWFGDLICYGLLRDGPFRGNPEELQRQRSYLESWGYLSEDEDMACAPFRTCYSGLLTSPRAAALFLNEAHRLTGKVVFQTEPFYAVATFGLAGLELLTSTGMRVMWNMIIPVENCLLLHF